MTVKFSTLWQDYPPHRPSASLKEFVLELSMDVTHAPSRPIPNYGEVERHKNGGEALGFSRVHQVSGGRGTTNFSSLDSNP
jgi:hypothetical protein